MQSKNLLTDALRTARPVFIYMGVFSLFINLVMLLIPIYSLQVLDRVLSTGSTETLLWLSMIMAAAFLAAGLVQGLRSFALIRTGEWLDERLGRALLSLSLIHAASTGQRGTQNLRDLHTIKGFLTGHGLFTLFDSPWSIVYLLVIFVIHPQLGVIATVGCLLLFALAWMNEIAMHKPLDEANETNVRNLQQVEIAMRNAEAIEAMGMMDTIAQRWSRVNRTVGSLQSLASYRSAVLQSVTKFLRLVLQIGITGWGAWLALNHELTGGGIIAASILTGRALAPFEAAMSIWKTLVDTRKSYHRLQATLAGMEDKVPGISLPTPRGYLTAEKLVYGVPARARPILKGVSFAIHPGESVGIIGPSAAGKSTLAKLIVGTWKPYAGVVRLDGGDVCQWKREEFGRHVGYLPQDVELFSGTVRENIARMNTQASDESIVSAAQMAGAHELIMMLPEGYDTDIGPQGAALSAGQRQRVGLARAFFGDPKLVVLDEPDASLDGEGEQALAKALQNAKEKGITMLVISHRRLLLKYVDKLMVLKEGELMLYGPTQEVMETLSGSGGKSVEDKRAPQARPKKMPSRSKQEGMSNEAA
jgi:PrtD family type I secretion system ABC transporter